VDPSEACEEPIQIVSREDASLLASDSLEECSEPHWSFQIRIYEVPARPEHSFHLTKSGVPSRHVVGRLACRHNIETAVLERQVGGIGDQENGVASFIRLPFSEFNLIAVDINANGV
jgi:hypothetical protein